jgi:hypothetical protein
VAAVCTATAADAVLNATDLLVILKRHNTSIVSGSSAMDIVFNAPVHWTASTRLTLDAYRSITVAQPVISMGQGAMIVKVNDGGSGGDLMFGGKGRMAFWDLSSSLLINGERYTLVGDIATLAADVAAVSGGRYAFADNYDASADGAYSQSPVSVFGGTFEGLGNTISHLTINGCCGLFFSLGFTNHPATVRDLILAGEMLHGAEYTFPIGGLAGRSYQGAIIGVSLVGGSIAASQSGTSGGSIPIGGLVGSGGQFVRSHSSARVTCEDYCWAGGLVGELGGSVTQSSASGPVTAGINSIAGGLVGYMFSGSTLSLSFATGAVSVGDASGTSGISAAGGLVGWSSSNIDQSYATGAVSGGTRLSNQNAIYVGGLLGRGIAAQRSYATGSATVGAGGKVGGLAGEARSTELTQTYSTGLVSGDPGRAGGFIGQDVQYGSTPVYNYWDLDTSGFSDPANGAGNVANDPGMTGLTTAQLQSSLPSGFDPAIWGQSPSINNGLPYLLALPPQ